MTKKENAKKHIKAVDAYYSDAKNIANLFAKKHGYPQYDDRDVYFVDDFCDTLMIGDYAFNMQTMIESLVYDLPADELLRWYDYLCDYMWVFGSSDGCPNFKRWCDGCPRLDLAPIMKKKRALNEMVREAKETWDGF